MIFRKSPEAFWNLISSKYAATPISNKAAYEMKIKHIKTYLQPEFRVLDFGCGTGTQCGDIANTVKQVIGIDTSYKLVNIANMRKSERKLENVEFINTTLFDERFVHESFDVVVAFYVLHLVRDIDAIFNRIFSLLKPGGIFILETACLGDKNKLLSKTIQFAGQLGLLPMMNLLTTRQLEQEINKLGLTILEKKIYNPSNPEYTFITKK